MGDRILLVEDEAIIAMHAEDILADLGYDLLGPVSGVTEALTLLASTTPDAALLDLNLGAETSEPIARRLLAMGIPFAFATGYDLCPHADFAAVPVVQKPYAPEMLRTVLQTLLAPPAISDEDGWLSGS